MTTNNRMVIMGAIAALQQNDDPGIYTDSKHIVNAINDWLYKWKENNWKKANGQPVARRDLWEKVIELVSQKEIKAIHVHGHWS